VALPGFPVEPHDRGRGLFLNLTSETPLVFVMWRPAEDGSEPRRGNRDGELQPGGRLMDGGERVDPVPMPAAFARGWNRSSPSTTSRSRAAR
jgi:hypothetical protein